jgi:hypothetical protein
MGKRGSMINNRKGSSTRYRPNGIIVVSEKQGRITLAINAIHIVSRSTYFKPYAEDNNMNVPTLRLR